MDHIPYRVAGLRVMSGPGVRLVIAREALVVFEDRRDSRLLRCLRPGFRHCFCLTGAKRRWTLCDPLKSQLAMAGVDGLGALDLARRLASPERRILHGLVSEVKPIGYPGLRLLTCVEVVKRLIGLHASSVLTPHQLYRHLLSPGGDRPSFIELQPDG